MRKKLFTLLLAVAASVGTNAKLIDLTAIGTTIDEWTITEATLNATNSDEAAGKYVYDIKANVASESFINAEPNVVFQKKMGSDKAKAFAVYPGKCYEFGGKNGILILKGTQAGDTIKLTVAAKGSTAANFADADGTYPKNAVAVSEDLTLPAKQAGAEGADEQGYIWKVLEFESLGGDVEIKEFAGGYRIKSIQICNQVCYDGIYFYLDTANQTAEVTANPIHYTGDITIPTHITHENVIYSVVGIGDCAFINSNNLTSITMESETPISVGNRAFEGVNCPFYVPCGSLEAYKVAWSEYASRLTYSPSKTCIFNISTTSANPEWGTTSGDTTALYLDEVEISAIPNYGYHFVRWNDYNTSNPRTVSVTQYKTYTATFAKNVYSITKNAEHGIISGNTSAEYMDEVTLTVTPNYGYHFTQWSDGLKDNPRIFQITKDTTFTAEFAKNSYAISTISANPEWGTTAGDTVALYLDEVEISAIPNYGYHFVRWNDNNTSNPRTVTVTTNETYTATFAKDIFSITKNAEHGSISGVSQAEYLDNVTLTVNPNYGYHFTQWSDGNTDNPRTIVLTQDTTFTAEIVIDRIGTCGDDNALTWTYDAETKTLTITGNGTLNSNYYFGIEAPAQMQKLVIGNEVTSIGDSAFYEMSSINHLIIGGSVATIGNYAFAECRNFDDITCFATIVPVINETTFANVGNKQYIYLFVPEARERAYHRDTYWGEFDIQVQQAEEATVATNDVQVEPQDNAATVTWPTSENAASYTIQITKDGVVFCTLVFNSNGQLTGIAFAPSREGSHHAPAAIMTANGLQFTVTGLNSGTHYALTLQAKDNQENVLASYSSEFTTTSEGIATGVEEVSSSLQGGDRGRLILHNGQIFILRGEKVYTLQGQEMK